jgi:hypothetical protein
MLRRTAFVAVLSAAISIVMAEDRSPKTRINVDHYLIEADINPRTQSLTANVQIQFLPVDDNVMSVTFELNNAMNVTRVVDGSGRQIPGSRSNTDFTYRLNFANPLPKGKPETVTFTYEGRLNGAEDSPVYGIKFADIQNDFAYLMYPSRWFPINDYTTDRYTADMKITVPSGFTVVASGDQKTSSAADKSVFTFHYAKPSFPGSIAVVQGEPQKVNASGINSTFYFRTKKNMANAYGEEVGKVMTYLTSVYGLAPQANLTFVETDNGTPSGYSAPGVIFLSPKGIGDQVSVRLLANQLARQWWGALVSPVNRNHIWLQNGNARYAEMLYMEQTGPGAMEQEVHDTYVAALTVDNPPLIQAARLDDYSPEYWAETASKGAAVLHMLRSVMGDKPFFQLLKTFPDQHAWGSVTTEEFRKLAEQACGDACGGNLQYFFLQWLESTGAPEFRLEYTVFRTTKGFRVMGKVSQDLDTFHMPVELKIETEGNPEEKKVDVVGTSSEFSVDTFGKPKTVTIDPAGKVLRFSPTMRVSVAIKRGEQFGEVGDYGEALKEYQKALDVSKNSSLAQYRVAELLFLQNNYQSAANAFRDALNGDLDPKWVEVWAHIHLGYIFDITGQRDRAVNEYNHAIRTRDDTQGAQAEAAKYLKQPYQRKSNNV